MDWTIDALTHIVAAGIGALSMRWWVLRKVRVRKIDGHTAFEVLPLHGDEGD